MDRDSIVLTVALGIGMLILSSGITLLILVRLPADYFLRDRRPPLASRPHPFRRILLKILKNAAGVAVVALGILLSIPGVPGQGILTILLGIMLLDFPGKFRLERRIVRARRLNRFLNRLRIRCGRRRFRLPADAD